MVKMVKIILTLTKPHLRGKRPLDANAAAFDPGSETRFHVSSSSILHGS